MRRVFICDQYIAIQALADALPEELEGQHLAMASSHYWLLLRAEVGLRDPSCRRPGRLGSLIEQLSPGAREHFLTPSSDVIEVLDFREYAYTSAAVAQRFRLNWLVADLVGAAVHHRAELRFGNPRNVPPPIAEAGTDGPRVAYRVLDERNRTR